MFSSKTDKVIKNLKKDLDGLETGDTEKCLPKLPADIQTIHRMLYGDSDVEPKKAEIDAIVPALLNDENDLFKKLAIHLGKVDFESKKKIAEIMNYIVRRTGKENNNFASYLNNNHDIVVNLLKGYHDQNLSQNVGSVLQEMCKRSELAKLLLNDIKIKIHNRNNWDLIVEANAQDAAAASANANANANQSNTTAPTEAKTDETNNNNIGTAPSMPDWNRGITAPEDTGASPDSTEPPADSAPDASGDAENKNNSADQPAAGSGGGDANNGDASNNENKVNNNNNDDEKKVDRKEYNDMVDELFILVQNPSFDIASDAYKTLQLLLTRHKKEVSKYLELNYITFFNKFNYLIMSENYVTKRQFLKLLSELLLDKHNFKTMLKYISEKENLINSMKLIKNQSKAIAFEAFHIFKVFVANPNKSRDVHIVLYKNQEKLVTFLTGFLKDKEDQSFMSEKEIVIQHLRDMQMPEEIRKKIEERKRLEEEQAQTNGDTTNNENNGNAEEAPPTYEAPPDA